MLLIRVNRRAFSDFLQKNKQFNKKVGKYSRDLNLHQKISKIKQDQVKKYINNYSKEQIATKIINESKYDDQFKTYIKQFNDKHKGQISLLDFSNYATTFGQLRTGPIKKEDIETIQEFQRRKIDQKVHNYREMNMPQQSDQYGFQYKNDNEDDDPQGRQDYLLKPFTKSENKLGNKPVQQNDVMSFPEEASQSVKDGQLTQGPFILKDNFMMLLLNRGISTKITTLNRLNFFTTLVFMGNGNGVISHGKGRSSTPEGSLTRAITQCKKNIIAIPLDVRCSFPRQIRKKHQDYKLTVRPLPGFNSWGHPTLATMLALAGIHHAGFKAVHTSKNVYDLCNAFFKVVTLNTTPQELAEQQGFKVYRHQFIRPLTFKQTHRPLSY